MTLLQSILPASEAFSSGTLEMSAEAPAVQTAAALSWGDMMLNSSLVALTVLLCLLNIKNFLHIAPSIGDCISRWKGCVKIDESIKLSHERNITALLGLLPFCLMADRYDLVRTDFMAAWPEGWLLPATAGLIAAWLLLHLICYASCAIQAPHPETFGTARTCAFDFFIPMVILMLVGTGICTLLKCEDDTVRNLLLYICGGCFVLMLVRKTQILRSFCNPFKTFLYLCALEIIPMGVLIAAVVLF